MKVSANGRFLVTCLTEPLTSHTFSTTTQVQVWDLVPLKKIGRTISVPTHRLALNPSNITVSSDGKNVFAVCLDWLAAGIGPHGVTYDFAKDQVEPIRDQGGIVVWNVETGEKKAHAYSFGGSLVSSVALSPDGKWLVISNRDELTCWKWKTKENPTKIQVGHPIVSLAFSQDSRYLAEGPRAPKGAIQIRDMRTLKVLRNLKAGDELPLLIRTDGLTFTRDGKRLIAGNAVAADELESEHRIHVWDLRTGELSHHISVPHHQVWSLTVTPDGNKIAARLVDGGKSLVAMWDVSESDTAAAADIKPGMTFNEVIAAKGRHYRPLHGMRKGQLILEGKTGHPLGKTGHPLFGVSKLSR